MTDTTEQADLAAAVEEANRTILGQVVEAANGQILAYNERAERQDRLRRALPGGLVIDLTARTPGALGPKRLETLVTDLHGAVA